MSPFMLATSAIELSTLKARMSTKITFSLAGPPRSFTASIAESWFAKHTTQITITNGLDELLCLMAAIRLKIKKNISGGVSPRPSGVGDEHVTVVKSWGKTLRALV